jgi:hypothetical protein
VRRRQRLTCSASNISYSSQSVTVQLSYPHALLTPVLRNLWGGGQGTLTLHASATFYLPQQTPVPANVAPSTPTPTPTPAAAFTCTPSPSPAPNNLGVPALSSGASYTISFRLSSPAVVLATWTVARDASGLSLGIYSGSTLLSTSFPFENTVVAFTNPSSPLGAGSYTAVLGNHDGDLSPGGTLSIECFTPGSSDEDEPDAR